jgi:hypothetical protein
MVRIKTCRLTRNPQLGDQVAPAEPRSPTGASWTTSPLHRSPGGRWFFPARFDPAQAWPAGGKAAA